MRAILFSFLGTGFLLLIASSWYSNDAATAAKPAAFDLPTRAPASNAAASREQIRSLFSAVGNGSPKAGEALAVALAEHFTNFGADEDLARAAVQCPDPLAQAVGLRMLATLPPSAENLSALGNGLRHPQDPALAEGAVRELQRYLGTRYETDAQRIVEALVSYGAKSPAERAASLVRPFINEHSYDEFRELASRVDTSAEVTRALKSALVEYERHR